MNGNTFDVMEKFGFGSDFLRWIKLLYKAPSASVLTNGLLSAPFHLGRGTAQGSPLSSILFDLAIEPLAMAIRQNPNIQGVDTGTKQHKILLYADDVLLTLTDPTRSLLALIECITEFGLISRYKVNLEKSEMMPLNNNNNTEPAYVKPFRWSPLGFNYLGDKITPQINQLYTDTVNPIVKNLKETLTRWTKLHISFQGRINLFEMTILPKILYPISMLFVLPTSNDIKVISKTISDFIWAGRKPKLKLETLQLPKQRWGLPNVEYYAISIQDIIISSWVNEHSYPPWLDLEITMCKPVSPVNLLDKRLNKLPHFARNNFMITNIL